MRIIGSEFLIGLYIFDLCKVIYYHCETELGQAAIRTTPLPGLLNYKRLKMNGNSYSLFVTNAGFLSSY